jgi:hypothetical protein
MKSLPMTRSMDSARAIVACLCLAVGLLLLPRPATAAEAAGVVFDEQARVGDTGVVLNGAGVRSVFMLKIYALGLYLGQRTADARQAVAMPGPKRIRLVTLCDVEPEQLLDGLAKGLEKNHGSAELAGLKARMDQFAGMLKTRGPLPKGSVVTIDLTPAGATRLAVNGNPLGREIAGEDFHQALLRVWLGDRPAQESLKEGLLAAGA